MSNSYAEVCVGATTNFDLRVICIILALFKLINGELNPSIRESSYEGAMYSYLRNNLELEQYRISYQTSIDLLHMSTVGGVEIQYIIFLFCITPNTFNLFWNVLFPLRVFVHVWSMLECYFFLCISYFWGAYPKFVMGARWRGEIKRQSSYA